jgi:hypothetical protein
VTPLTKIQIENRSHLIKFLTNISKKWVSEGQEARQIGDNLAAYFEKHPEFHRLASVELATDLVFEN